MARKTFRLASILVTSSGTLLDGTANVYPARWLAIIVLCDAVIANADHLNVWGLEVLCPHRSRHCGSGDLALRTCPLVIPNCVRMRFPMAVAPVALLSLLLCVSCSLSAAASLSLHRGHWSLVAVGCCSRGHWSLAALRLLVVVVVVGASRLRARPTRSFAPHQALAVDSCPWASGYSLRGRKCGD